MAIAANDRSAMSGAARVEPILCLPEILRGFGLRPENVFAKAAVSISILDSADNYISYDTFGRLLAAAAAATRCAHIGLLIAAWGGLTRLGPLGRFATNASTVGAALSDLIRGIPRVVRALTVSLEKSGGAAILRCYLFEPNVLGGALIRETIVATMVQVLRELCGPAWRPDLVMFSHRAHGPTSPYVKFFRASVAFNSSSAGLTFSARDLRRPVSLASQAVREAVKEQFGRLDAGATDMFCDRVRRQIHAAMERGQFGELSIARSLNVDTSTLRRKLAQEGAKFRSVVQEIKFGIATQLIVDTDLTLADVAAAIGFYESSVFSRAFRRWSGLTPSQWREREKSFPRLLGRAC